MGSAQSFRRYSADKMSVTDGRTDRRTDGRTDGQTDKRTEANPIDPPGFPRLGSKNTQFNISPENNSRASSNAAAFTQLNKLFSLKYFLKLHTQQNNYLYDLFENKILHLFYCKQCTYLITENVEVVLIVGRRYHDVTQTCVFVVISVMRHATGDTH